MKFLCEFCSENNKAEGAAHVFDIDCAKLDWKAVEAIEQAKGTEIVYQASWEARCPLCGNEVSAVFETNEYPKGVEVSHNLEPHGIIELPFGQ